jgi:hypothetical protein
VDQGINNESRKATGGGIMEKVRVLGVVLGLLMGLAVGLTAAAPAIAGESLNARLQGYSEVPANSTEASGDFRAKISRDESFIDYDLSYEDLEGEVLMSHIHIAQRGVNGGIAVWLCQTATRPAPVAVANLTPLCPAAPGKVSGRITAANVIAVSGPPEQGIASGEFDEVVKAIRAGVAYVNVHSTKFAPGEVRGQVRASRGHHGDRD